ncbi:hypothetical protein U5801_21050 [Lamprobacter modestohalophilus]|uniref:hypothetical protein n=1 Tax=Lamprobacter modestohalophilus TaxID=1064514 RepID=UPI002ADEE41A|nr:hypothetical protein [Lamprobacter modestohalophilus]MEA1052271.1 hypothetical protein [Lamprobacter modestohalophilus]
MATYTRFLKLKYIPVHLSGNPNRKPIYKYHYHDDGRVEDFVCYVSREDINKIDKNCFYEASLLDSDCIILKKSTADYVRLLSIGKMHLCFSDSLKKFRIDFMHSEDRAVTHWNGDVETNFATVTNSFTLSSFITDFYRFSQTYCDILDLSSNPNDDINLVLKIIRKYSKILDVNVEKEIEKSFEERGKNKKPKVKTKNLFKKIIGG